MLIFSPLVFAGELSSAQENVRQNLLKLSNKELMNVRAYYIVYYESCKSHEGYQTMDLFGEVVSHVYITDRDLISDSTFNPYPDFASILAVPRVLA